MGRGYQYRCSVCGKDYSVSLGIGMMYPTIYKETVAKIEQGEYGEEWKTLYSANDHVAVESENYVYVCSSCNSWKVDKGLSLYTAFSAGAKKSVERGCPIINGIFRTEEEAFKLLKSYIHKCDKCGSRMHKADREERSNLSRPYCGGPRDKNIEYVIEWD